MTVKELIVRLEKEDPDGRVYFSPAGDDNLVDVNDIDDIVGTPDGHIYIYGCKEKE